MVKSAHMRATNLLDTVRKRLPGKSEKAALEEIAAGSKVPYHTLLKIANGQTADPRISTVDRLIAYFESRPEKRRQ